MNMVDVVRNLWLKSRVKYEDEEIYGDLVNSICEGCNTECEMQEECLHFQQMYIQSITIEKFSRLSLERLEHTEEL